MSEVTQMLSLVDLAESLEGSEADAAALLADAAAFLSVRCSMPLPQIVERLSTSYVILEQAKDVAATGSRRSH